MRKNGIMLFTLLSLPFVPAMASAVACSDTTSAPLPVRNTPVPPLAAGLAGRPVITGLPHVLLSESRDESLALDIVLLRLRLEGCIKDEFANYKPKTQFDNTPWRYNMEKGSKFTAEQFDAWMKSRGVRVAKGKAPAPEAATAPAAQTVGE